MIFSETDPVANSAGGGGAGGGISLCDYRPIISSNMFMIPANHHQFTPDTVAAAAAPPFMAAHHQNKFMGYPPGLSLGQPWFMNQPSMADVCFESVDSGAVGVREDELDSKSVGSDNAEGAVCGSGEDHEGGERRPRKKRYHRHTQHQIQEMEMFFKECPHPDDKQRKELSRELRLDPLQVKFWFQNKRTQMKTQLERMENSQLKAENEKLMAENMRYKEALSHASCPNCGGPSAMGEISFDEHQLRLENARLRQEIDRISGIAVKHVGKPLHSLSSGISRSGGLDLGMDVGRGCSEMFGVNSANVSASSGIGDRCLAPGFAPTEMEKPVVMELAVEAMEEFIKLAHMGSPLWNFSTHTDSSTAVEILNENEYARSFPACGIIGPRPYGFRAEASRASGAVMLDAISLVETLMDVNRWLTTFPDIISRANSVDDMPTGVAGNYNGALQVMFAEVQLPTPLVPAREYYFARYCKQHSEGVWAVVDVSLDLDSLRLSVPSSMNRCRRRPSGLLIQHVSNGCSKVTWVEHVEVEERETKEIYRYLVNSGMAFGAKRWLATLQRQSERMTTKISTMELSVIPSEDGRKRMMKLAERMVISFCEGAGASTAGQTWTPLAGAADDDDDFVRIMTRKSVDDPGRPPGIVLSAATSFWLPLPHLAVFDFLRNSSTRNEWDILANGAMVQEIAHIVTGQQPGNSVSLMRVNNVTPNQSSSSNNNNMLILQESSRHECGCMVIYAPVYVAAMNAVLRGGDPDLVALLPSGFALVPDHSRTAGSLLTVAFQILVDPQPSANLSLASIATVNKLISCTVQQIRSALLGLSDKVINSV